jgi:hypothetical protein
MSNTKEASDKSSFKKLFTRETANKGRKMPIKTIEGKDTGDWLLVLGSESDTWAGIKADYYRQVASAEDDQKIDIDLTGMVIGWSFSEPCTHEFVEILYKEAPYIKNAVDVFSSKEANLLKKD